jgi:molybdopterin-guanine dinucleotide biosynthesis protein A
VPISALVLAGGRSTRMGADKALLRTGGRTMLDRTVDVLISLSEDVVVVGRDYAGAGGVRSVADEVSNAGPLGGLSAGLQVIRHDAAICVGCDQPFLNRKLLSYLASVVGNHDAVVPRIAGRSHPLHAVYSRDVAPAAGSQIECGDLRLRTLLGRIRVRWVDEREIDPIDPDHRSLLNVNTPEEWKRTLALYSSP